MKLRFGKMRSSEMVALLVGRTPAKHDVLLGRASRPITALDDEDADDDVEDDTDDEDEDEDEDEDDEAEDDDDADEELDELVDDEEVDTLDDEDVTDELLDEVDTELLDDDGDNVSLPPLPPEHAVNNRHDCTSSAVATTHCDLR